MKIAVVAANGKAGSLIVEEAVARGHEVTAIVRHENKTKAQNQLVKDLYDLTREDLQDFDAAVDAFGVFDPDKLDEHQTSLKHLADSLSGTATRLLVVGGAGSLYVNPEHTIKLMDTPDFPDAFKGLASNMGKALDVLKTRDDVNWIYISPAADFQADGEKTGSYQVAGEELTVNSEGESVISYADYAIAMIDEIENGKHSKERISVVSK
ncbi:NAD(P)-dependent oxidoreductase [Enterococcus sp. BWR-S5]|uniref:NAD(P)-dependent oxidoreductase n=1 Tax=Enterococcus sp. BWR-S5 TaxID=2787714 RepID=UPI00192253F1|nr:NAD(P)-dependent oxidoreductase [Enterococcus sp. BWR-S5]MBL1225266.1 NAD(P)-dependent oxidoreductase [Enterococcus sp. BWR-S5]